MMSASAGAVLANVVYLEYSSLIQGDKEVTHFFLSETTLSLHL